MEIVSIDEIEYIDLLSKNLKNVPIWSDLEALDCYEEKELIKVCKGDNTLAVFLIPLNENGVRRKFRFFPYCMPILLSDANNMKQKEIYKLIFNYIFNKYDYIFIPLHPEFKIVSSISSEDGFVEMRHTHVLINNHKSVEFNSKLKNHIRSAEKKVLVNLDCDYSTFDYDLAIKGNVQEQKERSNLAKKLLDAKKSFLVKAIYNNEIIAGIQIIYDKEWAYLLHSYQKEKIRGTIPLLINTAINECFNNLNINFFDFEGSVIDEIDDFFSSFNTSVITYPYIIYARTEEKFVELVKRSKNIQGRVKKMKTIEITKEEYNKIKEGEQTQIIIEDDLLENKDKVVLKYGEEIIDVEITAKAKYDSLDNCFKIIPIDLFGFTQVSEANEFYKNKKGIIVYRLKIENNDIPEINDEKLLSLIDIESIKKNNVGHSSVDVFEVKTTEGKSAILKIQRLSTRNDLSEEFKRIDWLQNKFRIPKIYYYKEQDNKKYLLMEKIEGVSAHKYDGFAYIIGRKLKEFHSIDISDCAFKKNNIENLMKNALDNIDVIYSQIKEESGMTKEQLIEFIKNNAPTDKVLVHGDYSLPNVLINEKGEVGVIDLGDVSISSKYFDFYYLVKSLKRNKKEEKLEELLNGYGIDSLDDNYMKWIEFVDKALF